MRRVQDPRRALGRRGRLATAVATALVIVAAGGPTRAAAEPGAWQPLPEELEVARLVNEFRSQHGLPALAFDAGLGRAARGHAQRMAATRAFEHVLDGQGPQERAAAAGFRGMIFENIARGSRAGPRSFVELWIASGVHRANLLAVPAGAIGVGVARSSDRDEGYCAAMFAATP